MRPLPTLVRPAFLLALLFAGNDGRASQYLAVEIDLHFISGDQYEVKLLLWRDCQGLPPGATQTVQYNSPCGSGNLVLALVPSATANVSPLCATSMPGSTCTGGALPGIQRVEYAGLVNLAPCDAWTFQYASCCLVPANNMNTTTVEMVTRTTLNNLDMPCRDTPRFMHPALPWRSSNNPFTLDMAGLNDGPGTAHYALVPMQTSSGVNAPYLTPMFTGPNPYPGLTISTTTGVLTTPSSASAGYWIIVPQLRQMDGINVLASVERVLVMPTSNLNNQPPLATDGALTFLSGTGSVTGPRTIEVPAGGTICATLSIADPDLVDSVIISTDLASMLPGATVSILNGNPASLEFCWTAPPGSNGMHHFMATASDERCPLDQDQHFLYQVLVTPDITNPCFPTSTSDLASAAPGLLLVVVDPSGGALSWTMPEGRTASRITLYDMRGAALVERTSPPQGTGVLPLPPAMLHGVYVLVCDDLRTRVVIAR
ncbi:MAG: hypothetical protein JNM31_03480 [Flavobacteriales bacterium]|nr:hypothetical protein [Flavobacteriales bacterium]